MEDKLAELERSNFDLKMRIYYLNNKLAEAEQGGYLEDSAEKVVNLLQQRDSTADKLREENNAANRRISELETELNLLKTKLEAQIKSRDVALSKARDSSILQMEENLKRERQAALAVAQHDSSVIIQLEAEIKKLNSRHDSDLLLISEASEKCAKLLTTIGEKDRDIERKTEALTASKKQCEVLQEKIKNQDLAINELHGRLQSSFERGIGNTPSSLKLLNGTYPQLPVPHSTPALSSSAFGSTSPIRSAMPPPSMTQGLSNNRMAQQPEKSIGDASAASPKPAPKLGAPHMVQTSDPIDAMQSSIAAAGLNASTNLESMSYHRSLKEKYFSTQSTFGLPSTILQQPSVGPTAETIRNEIVLLKAENEKLKSQLENERSAMTNLQSVLENVKTAAEEITLLEAEEIARLESELEKTVKEKNRLLDGTKKNQETIEQLRVQVFQLEAQLKESTITPFQMSKIANSKSGQRQQGPDRQTPHSKRNDIATSQTRVPNSSFDLDAHSSSNGIDGAAVAYGGHGKNFLPSPQLPSTDQSGQHQAIVDMYRQRESELLEALEAVIHRCQELEQSNAP